MKLKTNSIADKIIALNNYGEVQVVEPDVNSPDAFLSEWHVILNSNENKKNFIICDGSGKSLQEALNSCIKAYNFHATNMYIIEINH